MKRFSFTLTPKTLLRTNSSFGCLRIAGQTIRQRPCLLRVDEAEDRLSARFYSAHCVSSCRSQHQLPPTRCSPRCGNAGLWGSGSTEQLCRPGLRPLNGADKLETYSSRRDIPCPCSPLRPISHRHKRSHLRVVPSMACWLVHHPRRSHLRLILHQVSEA